MTQNEIRNQELNRHEEKVDRNVEDHLALNLNEKKQGMSRFKQNALIARGINILYYFVGALELLLAVRVFLHLVDANARNSFANFVYLITTPFVSLFATLVPNPVLGASGILEITTLIAMMSWSILAWLTGRLIWLAISRPHHH